MADETQREPARALAKFFIEVSPRLLHELAEAGVLAGVTEADARSEWQAVALHASIRGVVSEDERSDAKADLVDELHDLLLPSLAPADGQAVLRTFLALRYGEYDGIARTHGR